MYIFVSLICLCRLKSSLGRKVSFASFEFGRLFMKNYRKSTSLSRLAKLKNPAIGAQRLKNCLVFKIQKTLVHNIRIFRGYPNETCL